jgi:hypothetical protein
MSGAQTTQLLPSGQKHQISGDLVRRGRYCDHAECADLIFLFVHWVFTLE